MVYTGDVSKTPRPRAPRVPVNVTDDIIDDAVRGHSGHCMVAEAVKATYPGAAYVSVDLQTIRFTDPTKRQRYTYLTPRTVQVALCRFDEGDTTIEPFNFQLRNGQVTAAGSRKASFAKTADADDKSREVNKGLRQAHLLLNGGGSVPDKVGGTTPPRAPLASGGKIPRKFRRQFGVRALERNGAGETLKTGTRVGNPLTEKEDS